MFMQAANGNALLTQHHPSQSSQFAKHGKSRILKLQRITSFLQALMDAFLD
jgi:hypothetical protein